VNACYSTHQGDPRLHAVETLIRSVVSRQALRTKASGAYREIADLYWNGIAHVVEHGHNGSAHAGASPELSRS